MTRSQMLSASRACYASARDSLRAVREWMVRGRPEWAVDAAIEAAHWRQDAREWRREADDLYGAGCQS